MSKEINRIRWKCRRGMREIDLLLREFANKELNSLGPDQILIFEEILNYDDQKLYDFIFKNQTLNNSHHELFINKYLKTFTKLGNF
tara:strand:+ start:178 stop:435 length:258 start_codon:yes stop_codon:yes gene_type:complete